MEPVLEIQGVRKRFGAVVACDDISLSVEPGEVRGLLGQNGAGKSTLMKIVAGIERADSGVIRVGGLPLRPADPKATLAAGIGVVHQHFSLVERLKVWENLTLGEPGRLNAASAARRVVELGERYGLVVDPYANVADLAPGERQRVEIVKCLRSNPRLIILDEPTSVLTRAEALHLFSVLSKLVRSEARSIILISHRLEEVLEVTDRITVLRDGAVVSTLATRDADVNMLATAMLGRAVTLRKEGAAVGLAALEEDVFGAPDEPPSTELSATDEVVLEVDDAVIVAADGHRVLDELSLVLRRGEILGIAGVEGNGQTELADVLSGLLNLDEGSIKVSGQPMRHGRHADLEHIGIIPPDGHLSGCVLQLSIAENLVLDRPGEVVRRGVIRKHLVQRRAERLVAEFAIATPSVHLAVGALSGGNRQRVILARELSRTPKVLVVSQPTQGLDVGAMEDIWSRLREAAAAGTAILLISPDLDEILAISDRVAVIYRGRLIGEMTRSELDHDILGRLMGGARA